MTAEDRRGPPRVTLRRDCLGGERIVDIELPNIVSEQGLARVGVGTVPVVLGPPARPFFRLDVVGRFLLTGVLGEHDVRFTVRRALREEATAVALAAAEILVDEPGDLREPRP